MIEEVRCSQCGKAIGWQNIGDEVYSLKREELSSKCSTCHHFDYDRTEWTFCCFKCFIAWIEKNFVTLNPSKREIKRE